MVIETLGSRHQTGEHSFNGIYQPVVYFYCNRNDPQRRDPTTILQAIVKQVSLALPGLPKLVVTEYDKRVKDGFASGSLGFQECYTLLVSLLDIFPQTTIIIDALDECDLVGRSRLLEVLTTIAQSSANVEIFISSRDDKDIKLKLNSLPNHYITAQDNKGDIKRFIDREIRKSITNHQLSDPLRNRIQCALQKKANGM